MLQNHISSHYSGDQLHDTAISQAALDSARRFHSSFVRPYTRGQSEKKQNKKNMKLVAGNVFYICKGRLYLALLLPFQKKSNMILKKIIKLSSFLIAIKFIPENASELEQNQSPINQSLNFTSRITLPVLDLNTDSENCFSLFLP